jgi:hypothetical protein
MKVHTRPHVHTHTPYTQGHTPSSILLPPIELPSVDEYIEVNGEMDMNLLLDYAAVGLLNAGSWFNVSYVIAHMGAHSAHII